MSFPSSPTPGQVFVTALGTVYTYDGTRGAWIITGGAASGYSGASGSNGASGYSGSNGTSGYSGSNGTSGYSGSNGTSGYSGVGTSGYSGKSGYSGYSGTQNFIVNGFPAQPSTPTFLWNIADSNLYVGGITGINNWVQLL